MAPLLAAPNNLIYEKKNERELGGDKVGVENDNSAIAAERNRES